MVDQNKVFEMLVQENNLHGYDHEKAIHSRVKSLVSKAKSYDSRDNQLHLDLQKFFQNHHLELLKV